MSYRTVRQAQNAVWPPVRKSLELHQASRRAAREGQQLSRMEERDNAKSWNRVVSEETIWAIAKADLLSTPEHAAVVKAAKDWVTSCRDLGLDVSDLDAQERALYDSVQSLAASFEPDDNEDLQLSPASSTVNSTTH